MKIYHGTGDDPIEIERIWLETCSDGHLAVTYIAGAHSASKTVVGAALCPACAAIQAVVQRVAGVEPEDVDLNETPGADS